MTPLIARGAVSFKNEIMIVLATLAVIILLPVVALASAIGSSEAKAETAPVALYTGPISTTNAYFFGQCTYWAALRREQDGHPIPNNWGNANTWAYNAISQGYKVDRVPSVGAIMQTTAGPYGHVAYVDSVNAADQSWTISEMNFIGWDQVSTRKFTAKAANEYSFIHEKIQ